MDHETNQSILPAYFISHGGGPWVWMPEMKPAYQKLKNWSQAPSARAAHPREDHLVPLHVAVGAAEEEKGVRVYHEDSFFGGISVSSYRFGALPQPGSATEKE
jgi:hypothetical protein